MNSNSVGIAAAAVLFSAILFITACKTTAATTAPARKQTITTTKPETTTTTKSHTTTTTEPQTTTTTKQQITAKEIADQVVAYANSYIAAKGIKPYDPALGLNEDIAFSVFAGDDINAEKARVKEDIDFIISGGQVTGMTCISYSNGGSGYTIDFYYNCGF